MALRGQTSLEYLLLTAGVLLIVLVAGLGALNSANTEYSAVKTIQGADVAPPSTTLRESEVPTSAGTTTTITPTSRDPPTVSCSVSFSSDPPETGDTFTFSFTASDTGSNLDHAEVSVYIDGAYSGGQTYPLSGGSASGTYTRSIDVNGEYRVVVTVYDSLGDSGVCEKSFTVTGTSTPPPTPSACLEGNVDFYITDLNITPWLPEGMGYALGSEYTISFKVCRRAATNDLSGPQTMRVEVYDEDEPTAIVGAPQYHSSSSFTGCGTFTDCNFPSIGFLEQATLYVGECKDYTVTWRPTKGGEHRIVVKLMDVDTINPFFGSCYGYDEAYLVGGILKCADKPDESSCESCGGTWWNGSCVGCVRAWDENCSDNQADLNLYAGMVIYFSDCNEVTYWLNSDVVKSAVNSGNAVTLVQANDIVAEPNQDGTPREACIYASNFDYKDLVTIVGDAGGTIRTIYIGATTGEYNAYRAVYFENASGIVLKGMHLNCAERWRIVGERKPCVELVSSSASLIDSTVTDFGSVISGITNAIPVWLTDSTLLLDGVDWLVAIDDSSVNPLWSSFDRSMQDTLFVLEGSSQFLFGSSPIVYMKVDSDS